MTSTDKILTTFTVMMGKNLLIASETRSTHCQSRLDSELPDPVIILGQGQADGGFTVCTVTPSFNYIMLRSLV